MIVKAMHAALGALHYSGLSAAFRPVVGGLGAIFMLHHVFPGGGRPKGFSPNYGLEMEPEFLDAVISLVKQRGMELVSLDEAVERIKNPSRNSRRFAVFTLDDGYRDNLIHALPVFRKHNCPFAIYVAPAIADGTCELWWRALELIIAGNTRVELELAGKNYALATAATAEKWTAWNTLYQPLRNMDQLQQRQWIRSAALRYGIELDRLCRVAAMDWNELRTIAKDPLCTIGAHTIHHYAVARLSDEMCRSELVASADRIESELGKRPVHFAYPYGDKLSAAARDFRLAREAGYHSAVTTRKGMIFAEHASHLTALPRTSLSGKVQELAYVSAMIDGLPFALLNGFRKLNVS
jgi:peptidoglycan/xylan/chitin deacetylase (PgdA/CDA1 family)